MNPHLLNFLVSLQVQARVRFAWLAPLLVVMEGADVLLVLLDTTQHPAEQAHAQRALQDTIAKAAQAKLDALCTAHHQRLHTTSRAASAMQATAGRMAETAAHASLVSSAQESQAALDHH